MSIPLIFHLISLQKNHFIIYFLMPHYAKCDVISGQNNNIAILSDNNHLIGESGGMLLWENLGFLELGNAISRLLR